MKILLILFLLSINFSFSASDADNYNSFLSTNKWGFTVGPSFHLKDSTQDAFKLTFQQKFLFTAQTAVSYNLDWFAPKTSFGGNFLFDIVAFHYKRFTPNLGLGAGFNYDYLKSKKWSNPKNITPYLFGVFGFLFQISRTTVLQIRVPYYFGLNRTIFKNGSNYIRNNSHQRIGIDFGLLFSSPYTHVRKWIP